jgi:excisionase family DNA binding protein
MDIPINDLLTATQAAAKLKVSRQNIHNAIARGRLKSFKVGAIVLIEKSSLDDYAKSRKRTGRPPGKR